MANGMYTAGINGIMDGSIMLLTNTIKVTLINTANYTVNLASHDFIDDVPTSARKATGTLASKTVSGGAFDAADTVISGINADEVDAAIIWKDTGTESTSPLIAYIDTDLAGLPTGPLANNTVTITWNPGANKIFKVA